MAKRFTDTDKYKKPFIRGLQGPYKMLWDYLYHDCNHAGIWIKDFQVAQIYIGVDLPVNEENALRHFNHDKKRVVPFDNGKKWFLPSFIEFQYPELKMENRAHKSVIVLLEKHNLIKALLRPLEGYKVMVMVKDKVKVKVKVKDKESIETANVIIKMLNEKANRNYKFTDSNQKLIIARLKEGFVLNDFEKCIKNMCSKWKGDDKMDRFLRPMTLFSKEKFDGYVNESPSRGKIDDRTVSKNFDELPDCDRELGGRKE